MEECIIYDLVSKLPKGIRKENQKFEFNSDLIRQFSGLFNFSGNYAKYVPGEGVDNILYLQLESGLNYILRKNRKSN
jgi:hypothetical protein